MRPHPIAPAALNEEALEAIVKRARAGDKAAWQELWLQVAQVVVRAAGKFKVLSYLWQSEDALGDVVVSVMEVLQRGDSQKLAELEGLLAKRDGAWGRWLSAVAVNTGLNHVAAQAEYLGPAGGWVRHTDLTEARELEGERVDPLRLAEAHRIEAWAAEHLSPKQREALAAWLHETKDAAASEEQDDETARLVRSAVRRLRYTFAGEGRGKAREAKKK